MVSEAELRMFRNNEVVMEKIDESFCQIYKRLQKIKFTDKISKFRPLTVDGIHGGSDRFYGFFRLTESFLRW